MNIVNPIDFLRRFAWCDLQIDYDRFVPATHNYAAKRLLSAGVDLLVWRKPHGLGNAGGSTQDPCAVYSIKRTRLRG